MRRTYQQATLDAASAALAGGAVVEGLRLAGWAVGPETPLYAALAAAVLVVVLAVLLDSDEPTGQAHRRTLHDKL